MRGGLTNRVYVVTRWRNIGDGGDVEALEKFDVTDQYDALVQDAGAGAGRRSRKAPGALDRKCPTCGAGAGARCVRAGGTETGEPHAARRTPAASDPRQETIPDA